MDNKFDISHLLYCLAEEAGEIAQIAGKTGRFGPYSTNPTNDTGLRNVDYMAAEVNDLLAVVEMLQEAGVDIPGIGDRQAIEHKKAKVRRYMEMFRGNQ